MNVNPVSSLSSSYLQAILANSKNSATGTTGAASLTTPQDSNQLSPFAQLMSQLQQLQQQDPADYSKATAQIATNLKSAAQTASSQGDTAKASQLNQLANDFQNASTSGQLPGVKDLAQVLGGHHHHHHHGGFSYANSSSQTDSSTSKSDWMSTQANSLNPMAIIANTLANYTSGTTSGTGN